MTLAERLRSAIDASRLRLAAANHSADTSANLLHAAWLREHAPATTAIDHPKVASHTKETP